MVEAKKPEVKAVAKPEVKLKHKVIGYEDYLKKAGALLEEKGMVDGMTGKVDLAIALLFEENEVVSIVNVKNGASKYLCKA